MFREGRVVEVGTHAELMRGSGLFELDTLRPRLLDYVRGRLDAGEAGAAFVDEVLRAGSATRRQAPSIMKRSERSGRDTIKEFSDAKLLVSRTGMAPLTLHFTTDAADALFPRLFPAQLGVPI